MARLHREQEAREYARMLSSTSPANGRLAYFAAVSSGHGLDPADESAAAALRESQQQVSVIVNLMASVVGVGAAVFALARWWDMPWRVLLAFGSALATAAAEGIVYWIWSERKAQGEALDRQATLRDVGRPRVPCPRVDESKKPIS